MSYAQELSVIDEISDHVLEEVQKLALAIDRDVVLQTPVDTALAASNWIVTTVTPTNQTVGIIGQAAAISDGASAIGKARPFFSIYIQNNLPYIGRLNDGYSQKAPSKYVDNIIARRSAE